MLCRLSNRFSSRFGATSAVFKPTRTFNLLSTRQAHTSLAKFGFISESEVTRDAGVSNSSLPSIETLAATYERHDVNIHNDDGHHHVVMDLASEIAQDSIHSIAEKAMPQLSKEKLEKLAHMDFNGVEHEDGGILLTTTPLRSGFKGTE